jgi:hypothetical protein
MRITMVSVVLIAAVFVCGCASFQQYPAFGTTGGGRLVTYDRRGAHNVLPPPGFLGAHPPQAPDAHPLR